MSSRMLAESKLFVVQFTIKISSDGLPQEVFTFSIYFLKTIYFVETTSTNYPEFSFFHYLIINPFLLKLEAKYGFKKIYQINSDYPKKGILFRDITTLIKNPDAFKYTNNKIIEISKKN